MSDSVTPVIVINRVHPFVIGFYLVPFIKRVLAALHLSEGRFSYTFMGDEAIIELNAAYLDRDQTTDVITFNLEKKGEPIDGDVYINVEDAARNAALFQHAFDDEIRLLIVHASLHLIGYTDYSDSEKATMHAMQTRILQFVG